MKHHKDLFKNGVLRLSRKISTGKSKLIGEPMDHENESFIKEDECKDQNDNGGRKTTSGSEDNVSGRIEEPNSSSTSDVPEDKRVSDANIKATDTATNLRQKLRSLSPTKRKSETDYKEKGSSKKSTRISQLMSGASFKTKCALFKRVFKDLGGEESLIIDYSCALQRDILVHGRIYLSQNWLCFYSNIFGWETLVTINWHEITAITKEKTARVIPNAVRITTSREKPSDAFELRKLCRKFRKRASSDYTNGLQDERDIDETGDEATENDNETQSMTQSEISQDHLLVENGETIVSVIPPTPTDEVSENSIWLAEPEHSDGDKNEANSQESKVGNNIDGSDESSRSPSPLLRRAENLLAFARRKRKVKKKVSNKIQSLLPSPEKTVLEGSENEKQDGSSSDAEHGADDTSDSDVMCPCIGAHPGTEYCVEEFDFDVDALFEHLFSIDSDVMKQIYESRKMLNVKYHDIIKNEDGSSERLLNYLLTLNYTIGPKHSDTTIKQIFHKDNTPGSFYVIETEVFNKGIPYADSFHIFTLYCLTRLAGNRCRMRIHSEVRYTKSMMGIAKSMIQRNSDQAFVDYFRHLVRVLREKSESRPIEKAKTRKGKRKVDLTREKELKGKVIESISDGKLKLEPIVQHNGDSSSKFFQLSKIKSEQAAIAFTIMLVVLLVINIYLCFRVYHLEKFAVINRQSSCIPSNLPVTDDNWYRLLQTQRRAHDLEVKRLKDVVGGTVTLIKQIEASIKELYNELDHSFAQDSTVG